mmetsp:Transcript_18113/g.51084  ORF Transcript_18113/g.51084 Transcript_18113/m.51084 type:complete len:212 (+) Transcript_18113:177-812(+)
MKITGVVLVLLLGVSSIAGQWILSRTANCGTEGDNLEFVFDCVDYSPRGNYNIVHHNVTFVKNGTTNVMMVDYYDHSIAYMAFKYGCTNAYYWYGYGIYGEDLMSGFWLYFAEDYYQLLPRASNDRCETRSRYSRSQYDVRKIETLTMLFNAWRTYSPSELISCNLDKEASLAQIGCNSGREFLIGSKENVYRSFNNLGVTNGVSLEKETA